ncbi:hypothetical protein BaRGS_00006637 [Batillaria attramentaria]|uniref:Uncharacterized protein n=1 Tax=Batillaria attramentaria TaxID=370345 RepID=A0ABD0LSX1_9CAEN
MRKTFLHKHRCAIAFLVSITLSSFEQVTADDIDKLTRVRCTPKNPQLCENQGFGYSGKCGKLRVCKCRPRYFAQGDKCLIAQHIADIPCRHAPTECNGSALLDTDTCYTRAKKQGEWCRCKRDNGSEMFAQGVKCVRDGQLPKHTTFACSSLLDCADHEGFEARCDAADLIDVCECKDHFTSTLDGQCVQQSLRSRAARARSNDMIAGCVMATTAFLLK